MAQQVKNPPAMQETRMRHGFDPWVRKIPSKRKWQPTPVSLLEKSMDRGSWQATVPGVTKSGTWLSTWHKTASSQSSSVQFSSVAQSCPTLCNPMNRSTPGFPVHHQLLEFTQTHVHRVDDAIQPISSSVLPFSSCLQSLPASESFPMSQLFA